LETRQTRPIGAEGILTIIINLDKPTKNHQINTRNPGKEKKSWAKKTRILCFIYRLQISIRQSANPKVEGILSRILQRTR
jgi:hypothetical protein